MTSKGKHHKHPPLKRSNIGHYHRCEWAVYGTTCGEILSFYNSISDHLEALSLLYVDADHGDDEKDSHYHIGKKQFSTKDIKAWNHFDDRLNSIDADAAIVNGNHYPANRQIVIINAKKEASLKRRLDQLTAIDIVVVNDEADIFDFVRDKMTEETLILSHSQLDKVAAFIQKSIEDQKPPLKALILAGGKSQRMGFDKSQISYHVGLTQEEYLRLLLRNVDVSSYLSKKYNYAPELENEDVINDKLINMGPFGAIISAMMHDPNSAWLVVACDLPFINEEIINELISKRNPSKVATAFRGVDNRFPEPLITIYEPRAYQRFLSFLSLGYACPRKVLINSDIEEIILDNMQLITNANTPEEMEAAKQRIADES